MGPREPTHCGLCWRSGRDEDVGGRGAGLVLGLQRRHERCRLGVLGIIGSVGRSRGARGAGSGARRPGRPRRCVGWLQRFTVDEIRQMASAIWPDGKRPDPD